MTKPDTEVEKNILTKPNLKLTQGPLPRTYSKQEKKPLLKPNPSPGAKPSPKSDTTLCGQPTTRPASKPVLQPWALSDPVLQTEPPRRNTDITGLKKGGTNKHPSKYKSPPLPPPPSVPPRRLAQTARGRGLEVWREAGRHDC